MKLQIELIPLPTMNVNVRSHLTPYRWKKLSQAIQQRDEYACVICGRKKGHDIHKLHCHEMWAFDAPNEIQHLTGFQSLCFQCHMVKHIGFADMNGWIEKYDLVDHFCWVNEVEKEQFARHLHDAVQLWLQRNRVNWTVDMGDLI